MPRRILVTGASVAGNTAAWWLGRYGFDVTVVERAPEFRDGGQNIDVRGAGREVLRRMGLERAALEHGTGEQGTAWVDEHGRVAAQITTRDLKGDGPIAEMEILRGDLARLPASGPRWRSPAPTSWPARYSARTMLSAPSLPTNRPCGRWCNRRRACPRSGPG